MAGISTLSNYLRFRLYNLQQRFIIQIPVYLVVYHSPLGINKCFAGLQIRQLVATTLSNCGILEALQATYAVHVH